VDNQSDNELDLQFSKITDTFDTSSIDCTEDDNSDSQGLQDYLVNHALLNQEHNLSTTYLARLQGNVVGYCNVAISTLPFELSPEKKPDVREEIRKYPVLFIANFAIDKKNRGMGIGSEMLDYCRGLGALLSDLVGCRYVMLYATTAETFYSDKNKTPIKFFVAGELKDGRKRMLYRIFSKKARHLSEKIEITAMVTAKVTKAEDVEKMKNNPRLCNSCGKETEIVFRDGNFRLCKVCQDNLKEKYGYS